MTLHITEMPYPQTLYRRGFSDWCTTQRQQIMEVDDASTPRSVLDNLGLSEAGTVTINGAFLTKMMSDKPFSNILNGHDGFLTIVKEESK